ncbi:hypothetical protein [Tropicimonas isoalkanivorans]|uniref:Lipoprotein n=1 Tax=Tropicimonas isoalkanivorans TaxID=441112 RepID=A0A1I1DUC4_9RHOB|nr:hypothetical protein [Tropicimonas isoalkanivorans]SFB78464.1 hypothetical protein SAMN04488094_101480 [Tropicimonas isoalkanivorans]
MKPFVILSVLLLCGCAATPDVPVGVTSRAPNTTFDCIAPRLERLPVRFETERTPDGWRMDVQIFAGPPSGWYHNGRIEHSGHLVVYAPDGATRGIGAGQADKIAPIIRRCSGG